MISEFLLRKVRLSGVAVLLFLFQFPIKVHAQNADGVCGDFSSASFGICTAYCDAQGCDAEPQKRSCQVLRLQYKQLSGSFYLPCDTVLRLCDDSLSDAAFSACYSYCEGVNCDEDPTQRECDTLREKFQSESGQEIVPCDLPPGCDGVPGSGIQFDECGVCGGDNSTCAGCDGVPNSGKVFDECGVCDGPGLNVCGECGAANDADGDGTPDCIDDCPSDSTKILPGTCGCGVSDADSDGDGIADCNDGCPSDSTKVAAGICGCGVSDADSDGDGVADCNDQCPADSEKTVPGACGCGQTDADSDGDGTADCNDECPDNPRLRAPGPCGCSDQQPDRCGVCGGDGSSCEGGAFEVTIDGVTAGRFLGCSGLSSETEIVYTNVIGPNGVEVVRATPGALTYGDLQCQIGVSTNTALWDWRQEFINDPSIPKRNVTIAIVNSNGDPVGRWQFVGAIPIKLTLDAMSVDVGGSSSVLDLIEELGLLHDGMLRIE